MPIRTESSRSVRGVACCVLACLGALSSVAAEPPRDNAAPKADKAQTDVHTVSADMVPIMALLLNHEKIHFTIEDVPGGERTTTTSQDPEIAKVIRVHAREMKARVKQGNVIRPNDPLFAEIFRRHKEIRDVITDVPGGVSEVETSRSAQVVLLIRAHAQAVAGFVRQGLAATRANTPLPKGYHPSGEGAIGR